MNLKPHVSIHSEEKNKMSEIHVKIAEVKTGQSGDILKATLGSCVGIAFIWKDKNLCGLAHCFLPETETDQHIIGAKYVNQAILSLMKIMDIRKEDIKKIEVYVAGGGNMMNRLLKSNNSQVGKFNAEAAFKYLDYYGFRIKESSVGSSSGSKIIVDCTTWDVEFQILEDLQFYVWKA